MAFEWMDKALCVDRGVSHDAWHPTAANYTEENVEALRLCNNCTVVDECLNYALNENLEYGIYGGTTARDRHEMRKNRQRAGKLSVSKVDGAWTVSDGKQVARVSTVQMAWAFVRRLVA